MTYWSPKPHAVYWLYGPGDLLLYIGMTKDPMARFTGHKSKSESTWWPWVQRHEIVWFPDQRTAALVEARELRLHRPLCNPVIPEENGRHVTVLKGRKPVRSLWDQCASLAAARGESVGAVIVRAIELEVKRMAEQAHDLA